MPANEETLRLRLAQLEAKKRELEASLSRVIAFIKDLEEKLCKNKKQK